VDEKPEGVPADVRRRIDEVFGDVLPDVTRDEVDEHRPSNDDALLHEIPRIAERAGEPMWPLPIPEEMAEKVRASKIADLSQHNTEGAGGALFAAAFLREFVGEGISWAHLDIAGPAFNDAEPFGYTPKGGTGASVRTLVQLATEKAESR